MGPYQMAHVCLRETLHQVLSKKGRWRDRCGERAKKTYSVFMLKIDVFKPNFLASQIPKPTDPPTHKRHMTLTEAKIDL